MVQTLPTDIQAKASELHFHNAMDIQLRANTGLLRALKGPICLDFAWFHPQYISQTASRDKKNSQTTKQQNNTEARVRNVGDHNNQICWQINSHWTNRPHPKFTQKTNNLSLLHRFKGAIMTLYESFESIKLHLYIDTQWFSTHWSLPKVN